MEQVHVRSKIFSLGMVAFILVAMACFGSPVEANADGGSHAGLSSAALSTQEAMPIEDVYFKFDDAAYTGSPIIPTHSASYWDDDFNLVNLVLGRDYTLAFQDNTNVGKAKVTVIGVGNFSGTDTYEFEIERRSLSDSAVAVAAIPNAVYSGRVQTPEPVLSMGGYTFKKGVDYLLEYSSNEDVGTAYIYCTGIGNFSGMKNVTFTILPASIDSVSFAFADQEYTGWAIEPTPVATFNGSGLNYGDYTISYANNVSVGTAQATITGNGNFTGSRVVPFKIVPSKSAVENSLVVSAKSKTLTVKYSKLKKKAQKISGSKAYKVTNYNGTLSYKKASVSAKGKAAKKAAKKIKVNKGNGAITLPKKMPKGTYTVNVKVSQTNSGRIDSVTVALKIKVK